MFRKNVTVINTRPLSGKDAKKLRKDVQGAFPHLTEADLAQLLPSKGDVQLLKLNTGALVYARQSGQPLFFDVSGRGDQLFPTVYALWEVPEGRLLKPVLTHGPVSGKVLGGADLFLQGFIVPPEGLGDFLAHQARSIAIPENAYPFGVGTYEVSAAEVRRDGMKGKGLKVVHTYNDELWKLGDKSTPCPQFTPSQILAQPDGPSFAPRRAPAGEGNGHAADVGEAAEEAAGKLEAASLEEPAAEAEAAPEPSTPAEVDAALDAALLAALHAVPDSELPLATSDLQARFLAPRLRPGVDLKKSSYKKLSKLLTKFEKKGVLSQKVVFKQDKISAIHRTSELYLSHRPSEESAGPGPGAAGSRGEKEREAAAGPRLEVTMVYRVPVSLRPVFSGAEADKEALFTAEEAEGQLLAYAQREKLAEGPGSMRLDGVLHAGLFNKKEEAAEGTLCAVPDLLARLLSRLTAFHRLCRHTPQGPVETLRRGTPKVIEIRVEERQGGRKHITRVTHVESLALDPDEVGQALQKAFQTACTITKMPGKTETDKELALQGDISKKIAEFLGKEFGVDKKYVELKGKAAQG